MSLLLLLLSSFSPGDSAMALANLRFVPEAAVLYAQMAAVENGEWLVGYGRLLEASGDFAGARRIYGLALGRSSDSGSSRWLLNRRAGTAPLDTTIVLLVRVANNGSVAARNIQVLMPEPVDHPPFQDLEVLTSDFALSMGLFTAEIPCLAPGDTAVLAAGLRIFQTPGTMRPVTPEISDETLNALAGLMRGLAVPDAIPGPCVPMSQELRDLAEAIGVALSVEGGLTVDSGELVFHAWNRIRGTGVRLDPLLFKTDSLLAVAHCPTDVIPLWELDPTDGYELTLLFDSELYRLEGSMEARFK